jgi:large subunit ribosomal protein L22
VKKMLADQGMTVEQVAEAVERDGLRGAKAVSAVRNWLRGSNHPRCSRTDLEAIASALGCQAGEVMRFDSMVRHHRGSPRKAKLVVDMIRGKSCRDADDMLSFSTKRAAVNVRKALQAAMADAESVGVSEEDLVVAESRVDEGPHIKRFRPKDRGRAHPILKRTSHITVGVEERA